MILMFYTPSPKITAPENQQS